MRVQFPSMLLAIGLGVALLCMNMAKLKIGAFHMKLTAVLCLIGCDLWSGRLAYLFERKGVVLSNRLLYIVQTLIIFFLLLLLFAVGIVGK